VGSGGERQRWLAVGSGGERQRWLATRRRAVLASDAAASEMRIRREECKESDAR
jgi:hypothetical protein